MVTSGTRVGHYEVLSRLGAGGMGQVYLAEDHKLGRKVALKFLPAELAADERAARRLVKEARAAALLDHPNICAIYEIGEHAGQPFIVLQYIEGETLADRAARGPLTPDDVLDMAVQVAGALAEAHARGIVHRDIKPQNIMLTARGQLKVLDFGLATIDERAAGRRAPGDADTATQLTMPGMMLGTLQYMSPEQLRGDDVDARSDVFSFGCVLYEVIWGEPPYRAANPAEVIAKVLTEDPLARGGPARIPELAPVVRRCLQKDRRRRYRDGGELSAGLESARAAQGRSPQAPRSRATRAWRVALVAGCAVASLVLALWGAARIRASATGARPAAARAVPAPEPGRASPAYDDYLRGKVKVTSENRESNEAAVRLLERAIAEDPRFAPAHAELARAYLRKAFLFTTGAPQKKLLEDAEVEIEKALELDANLAEAHLARGLLLWTHARQFPHEMAIRAFRKAAELNPGLDEARLMLSIVYLHVGLLDLAREEVEKALAINPDNTLARFRLGGIALFSGEYEEAVTLLSSIPAEASPSLRESALAAALVHAGKTAEAEALADTFLAQNPGDEGGAMTSVKAILFARAGRRAEAERAIAVAIELGKDFGHFHHTAFNIGSAYALLGQPERALEWLEVAAADGFPCYPAFTTDPTLASLRKDPRFEALLGRIRERAERIRSGTLSPIA